MSFCSNTEGGGGGEGGYGRQRGGEVCGQGGRCSSGLVVVTEAWGCRAGGEGDGGGVGLLTATALLSAPCSCAPPAHASPGERDHIKTEDVYGSAALFLYDLENISLLSRL